jgi:hypothetical protein
MTRVVWEDSLIGWMRVLVVVQAGD